MSDLLATRDQMGREVTFPTLPKRIISLVPSQTEFLIDIGAQVVGRTKFCVHPNHTVKDIPIIGGTKNFRFEKIRELAPDLIIGNKEENYDDGIVELEKEFPVWMSDIYTLEDAFGMMLEIGKLCDLKTNAEKVVAECRNSVEQVRGIRSGSVVYLIWKDPWMAAGKSTFIDEMLNHLGYVNLVSSLRYPELSIEELTLLNPDHILLSSEPYPFKEKHIIEVKNHWPNAQVKLVDGELHSWYGSRLSKAYQIIC